MSRLKAPADLPELVRTAFAKALSDGELHYFPTQVTILHANSVPVRTSPFSLRVIYTSMTDPIQFQLRFSPALANKPKGPPRDPHKKPFDPFENPPPALKITDLGPAHFLVLNKFAVVPEHFILATAAFKQQTDVLEADDLACTLACIDAYEGQQEGGGGGGLFAFFNGGEHSGASQPHRHIQLLPVARMRDGLEEGGGSAWDVLADNLRTHRPPFATFSEEIEPGITGAELHEMYLRLYGRACRAVARHSGGSSGIDEVPATGEARISYNMAMTRRTLVVSPRLAEGADIAAADGRVLGSLALNGTVLAGTALVKSELEWEALRSDEGGLVKVLRGIGLPADEVERESAL